MFSINNTNIMLLRIMFNLTKSGNKSGYKIEDLDIESNKELDIKFKLITFKVDIEDKLINLVEPDNMHRVLSKIDRNIEYKEGIIVYYNKENKLKLGLSKIYYNDLINSNEVNMIKVNLPKDIINVYNLSDFVYYVSKTDIRDLEINYPLIYTNSVGIKSNESDTNLYIKANMLIMIKQSYLYKELLLNYDISEIKAIYCEPDLTTEYLESLNDNQKAEYKRLGTW